MTTLESTKKIKLSVPQGTQNHNINSPSHLKSFEEVYKTSYSHGLEAIYSIETIDIKSIRRIETAPKTTPKKDESKKNSSFPLQEELDLGEEFRGWIAPFIKKEPIQVLELSKHAEKCLIENGKKVLGDLLEVNLKDFIFLRGMGQGHIEEIQQKLNAYVNGHHVEKCKQIDFTSWLKSIVATEDRKKVYAFLESYEITDLFSLTPGESVEVRKLTLEKKQEWIEDLLAKLSISSRKKEVQADMQQIFNVFFKPWIRQRGGFVNKAEVKERMQRISANPIVSLKVLQFLESVYFNNREFYNLFLQEVDKEIYCCDAFHGLNYETIVDKSMSYFYKPNIYYHLNELVGLIEKEFSKLWQSFGEGYIEKILRLSPAFYTVKGGSGSLEIHSRQPKIR